MEERELHTRPFADVLRDLRKGALLDELEDKLAEVVDGVDRHRKKGSLTLRLSIKPLKAGSNALEVEDKVTAKVPEPDKDSSLMFPHSGALIRDHPDQMSFDDGLRAIDGDADDTDHEEETA